MKKASVGIIGLGIAGMSIAAHLSRKGYAVTGFDKYAPPHGMGSSHGENRIIRRSPAEGATYVEMAARAYELWPQIEELSGANLFLQNGSIDISEENATWAETTLSLSQKFGLPAQNLTLKQAEDMLPCFNFKPGMRIAFSPVSGTLKAEESLLAMKSIALNNGAVLHTMTEVKDIDMNRSAINIADGSTHQFDHVVISAGPWIKEFVPLPVRTEKRVVAWYRATQPVTGTPSFIHFQNENAVYGMPGLDGQSIKFASATHMSEIISPDVFPTVNKEDRELVDNLAKTHLRNTVFEDARYLGCKYTQTANDGFLIDRHSASPNTLVFSACSGHGFKYAPVYGEIAEVLIERKEEGYPVSLESLSFKANNVRLEPTR